MAKKCPKPLECPTATAVASRAGTNARTCEGKRAALNLWMDAAAAEVARHPDRAKQIDRLFDTKVAAVEKFCSNVTARQAAEAAKIAAERERIVSGQAMDGLGRMRRHARRGLGRLRGLSRYRSY